jgi:mannitol-1-phosphate/altronate dehydrogenase
VHDVEPYELMKLRLLNAGHQALCYFGYLAGYRFAHEAMAQGDSENRSGILVDRFCESDSKGRPDRLM